MKEVLRHAGNKLLRHTLGRAFPALQLWPAEDPFEEEDVAINTRVPDTESELEGESDQPKARRTSRGRVPVPEKGQRGRSGPAQRATQL